MHDPSGQRRELWSRTFLTVFLFAALAAGFFASSLLCFWPFFGR
jgi:hypothetical protein